MSALTPRTKEAIKTALAMTIAYGIALSMDWDRPYWAGFAVAMISLSTVGQSLNKGAMRMLGTLVAVVVSLTLIALFPQQRWWFMVALSIFVGLCTYLMHGTKRQYFWQVAGFVTVIICLDGGVNSANAFETALLRAEQTGLGILVYSLVTILLWPSSTRDELDAAVRRLAATQHELYRRYRELLDGQGTAEDTHPLRMQEMQQFNQFSQALAAARTDSYEVWEVRRQWQRVQSQIEGGHGDPGALARKPPGGPGSRSRRACCRTWRPSARNWTTASSRSGACSRTSRPSVPRGSWTCP